MSSGIDSIRSAIDGHVLGAEQATELIIIALLAEGHVLIQGPPGMGKTSMAKALAACLRCPLSRIQFTPDLLPSDIVGYSVYDQEARDFLFHRGPLFGHVVLADEINRASPRTQSAMLEAMCEQQVSVDGKTYELPRPFFVAATENPLSSAGTFPLPDSQLDRFLISLSLDRPDPDTHFEIIRMHAEKEKPALPGPVMSPEELKSAQDEVRAIHTEPSVMQYVVAISEAIEATGEFVAGISTRASIGVLSAAKALAYLADREFVEPDDIKVVAPHVLRHRLIPTATTSGFEAQRLSERAVRRVLESVAVPAAAG